MARTNEILTAQTLMELRSAEDEVSCELVRIDRLLEEQSELRQTAQTLITAGIG